MRISDWSSDVCSSDLRASCPDPRARHAAAAPDLLIHRGRPLITIRQETQMLKLILLGGAIASAGPAVGQDMDHSPHAMHGSDSTAPWQPGSGTSRQPGFEPMTGAHIMSGDWMLMAHGYAWGVYRSEEHKSEIQ